MNTNKKYRPPFNPGTPKGGEAPNDGKKVVPLSYPKQDFVRNKVAINSTNAVKNTPNVPVTPLPCSGASFQCDVPGSGKTKIVNQTTYPQIYDHLATPIKEGGMIGRKFQPDVILNWQNNSIATEFTKKSLQNTLGFENFQ